MEKFRVNAKVTTWCYIDVYANSSEDAQDKAREIDGGDFTPYEDIKGEWDIVNAKPIIKTK
jgi:hypothetical protein